MITTSFRYDLDVAIFSRASVFFSFKYNLKFNRDNRSICLLSLDVISFFLSSNAFLDDRSLYHEESFFHTVMDSREDVLTPFVHDS